MAMAADRTVSTRHADTGEDSCQHQTVARPVNEGRRRNVRSETLEDEEAEQQPQRHQEADEDQPALRLHLAPAPEQAQLVGHQPGNAAGLAHCV
jgi:hypothetical protein